jgi:4-hydroxy-tetrahydrodipicolinate synthase
MMKPLRGVIPPMITPLDAEGHVDPAGVAKMTRHLLAGGVHGIFVLGTAGEGPAIRESERAAVLRTVVETVQGRGNVLAGCMAVSTARALDYAAEAKACGADAVVVTPPFYYGTESQEVMITHFRAVAAASPLPVLLYNIPGMTHSPLAPETIIALAEVPNIVGVKDSSGKVEQIEALLRLRGGRAFAILNGSEGALVDLLSKGQDGLVPSSGNIVPAWIVQLYDAVQRGDLAAAQACQDKIATYRQGVFVGGSYWVSSLKTAANLLGLCEPYATAPIPPTPPAHREKIRVTLQGLGLL